MKDEILIKDGVKYTLIRPEPETAKFEPMIKEHVKDIFGPGCKYFTKRQLKSLANNRRIPDGFVIDFENKKWYIVEIKLLCEDAISRIRDQLGDYKSALDRLETRREIYKSIKSIVYADFLDNLINEADPQIIVVIDSLSGEQGERFTEKVYKPNKIAEIIEFKTFVQEGTENVYIHQFRPLYYEIRPTYYKTEPTEPKAPQPMGEIDGGKIPIFKVSNKGVKKEIVIEDIQKIVADYYHISPASLRSQRRMQSIVKPRNIAIYLAREYTSLPFKDIGKSFGGRGHSTVIHSYNQVKQLLEKNDSIKQEVDNISKLITCE